MISIVVRFVLTIFPGRVDTPKYPISLEASTWAVVNEAPPENVTLSALTRDKVDRVNLTTLVAELARVQK